MILNETTLPPTDRGSGGKPHSSRPVHDFLSRQIKEACAQYQKVRDARKREEVDEDSFTSSLIAEAQLSRKETRLAKSVCTSLAGFHQRGVDTPEYQEHARLLVGAIGKGEVFSAISAIGNQSHPQLHDLASQIIRLTHAEIDQTLSWMRSRLLAIRTLERIVADVDFKDGNNEDELHGLLKESPWLIDPTYFEFLTSNRAARTLFRRLEKKLGTGNEVPAGYDKGAPSETEPLNANRRPDLVFLLGNEGLRRLVIVELKAPNTPLHHEHLMQLKDYMRPSRGFSAGSQRCGCVSRGLLDRHVGPQRQRQSGSATHRRAQRSRADDQMAGV